MSSRKKGAPDCGAGMEDGDNFFGTRPKPQTSLVPNGGDLTPKGESKPPSSGSRPGVSMFPPWDLLRGRCVFKHRGQLLAEAKEAEVSHWAPNCATYSRAREIPIQGVASPPRPLRNESNPEGIPEELARMGKRARRRLEDDTAMADLSAEQCEEAADRGKVFTLEHPGNSLARHLPSWKRLSMRSSTTLACLRLAEGESIKS